MRAPHTGQNQVSGISSKAVPAGIPPSGSPRRGRRCSRRTRRSSAAGSRSWCSCAGRSWSCCSCAKDYRQVGSARCAQRPRTSERPGPGEAYNPGRADAPAPGRERDPAARRRRGARGAARQAHAEGALHGRRVGVPRRRRRRRARATATRPTAPPRCASCSEEAAIDARRSRRARQVLALDHPGRGADPLRHALLPGRRCPPARSRGSTARSASTSAGSRRAARWTHTRAGEIALVFPTIKHLEQLGDFASVDGAARLRARARGAARAAAGGARGRGRAHRAARASPATDARRARRAQACWAAITCVTALISARCVNACG